MCQFPVDLNSDAIADKRWHPGYRATGLFWKGLRVFAERGARPTGKPAEFRVKTLKVRLAQSDWSGYVSLIYVSEFLEQSLGMHAVHHAVEWGKYAIADHPKKIL